MFAWKGQNCWILVFVQAGTFPLFFTSEKSRAIQQKDPSFWNTLHVFKIIRYNEKGFYCSGEEGSVRHLVMQRKSWIFTVSDTWLQRLSQPCIPSPPPLSERDAKLYTPLGDQLNLSFSSLHLLKSGGEDFKRRTASSLHPPQPSPPPTQTN